MFANIRFPIKTAAVLTVAVLLASLVADWVAMGAGCRAAFDVLRSLYGGETPPPQKFDFSLWGWIVRLVGWNVEALGVVSFAGAIVCAGLVGQIIGDIFAIAITRGRSSGVKLEGRVEFAGLRNAAVVIGVMAFALSPAFLRAATRMGPLMVWMVQPLAVVALGGWFVTQGRSEPIRILRRWWWVVSLALLVFGHSVYEAYLIRWTILEAWTGFAVFAAVGVAPCIVLAGLIRFRLLFIVHRRVQRAAFGVWALAVVVMGVMALLSVGRGRAASRLVAEIIANAEGKAAIVCDGDLEPLFAFALVGREDAPRLISLAHENDPAYGRRLAAWVRGISRSRESKSNSGGLGSVSKPKAQDGEFHCSTSTSDFDLVQVEDLAFAAELGAAALLDEWSKADPTNFEAQVATLANYFPTVEKWREACEVCVKAADEPFGGYLRKFLGAAGNGIGCRMLEEISRSRKSNSGGLDSSTTSTQSEAWEIFREITEKVDRENYTALLNRMGMLERGFKVAKTEADEVVRRCNELAKRLGTKELILAAVMAGGRLYVDPETAARREQERIARLRDRRLTPREEALVAAATKPPESTAECRIARSTLTTAVKDGLVRVDRVGHQLINLDFALGDWDLAERDAIRVLRIDRHHTTANAAMGTINGVRGDYERAERYLRRGMRDEGRGRSAVALNDLAFTLARTGRAKEAVPLAREAVAGMSENWNFRETLAYALIRAGEAEEGERELSKAEAGAFAIGKKKGEIVRFDLDRAWLFKRKGDTINRNLTVHRLRSRMDLSDSHRRELEEVAGR